MKIMDASNPFLILGRAVSTSVVIAGISGITLVIVLQILYIPVEDFIVIYSAFALGMIYPAFKTHKIVKEISSPGMKVGLILYSLVLYVLLYVVIF